VEFPTAAAVMELLDSAKIDLAGKKCLVVGFGQLVGRPASFLLEQRGLKVDVARSKTENILELIKNADVVISAVGKSKLITGDKIKLGSIIIDAGTSESDGGIVGDVDLESVKDLAGFVSPVPGGVGPVTVAKLLFNVLKVAKKVS
jgi:methylenetetrahydrofolate dehydrogenase (NADP+)/methenyltetrahydrofolate cyclohydrolase